MNQRVVAAIVITSLVGAGAVNGNRTAAVQRLEFVDVAEKELH